ncbi:uncharacterized protein I303_107329 [Kwoniella dejecticola CBS 10117]|uniref:Glycosyltransferase family 34 protein n=1 Tax=Kwoniella dejecticola CBS 10117 TaxID=1296121 RepID=A0A1A5ZZF7_9TREE|nr:uncharacterized protein I303_06734 [Kwoniella dejecticola CBS 10117]OBR83175.1 hypothetical protein I303_06734 [Kwoniella dejecticola CBS 10117]
MKILTITRRSQILLASVVILAILVILGIKYDLTRHLPTATHSEAKKPSSDFFTPIYTLADDLSIQATPFPQPSVLIAQHLPYFTPLHRASYATHKLYSEIWGYGYELMQWSKYTHVKGLSNKAKSINKIYAVHRLLANELGKAEADRHDWIFLTDVDTIVSNPAIPLHVLLPPATEDTSERPEPLFLITQDHNGFNAGVMLLRVHPTILSLLETVLREFEQILNGPTEGWNTNDQVLIARILTENPHYAKHVYEMPKNWFNSYFSKDDRVQLQVHLVNHFKKKYRFTPIIAENFEILKQAKDLAEKAGYPNRHGLDLLDYHRDAEIAGQNWWKDAKGGIENIRFLWD